MYETIWELCVKAVVKCVRQGGPSDILKELRCDRSKSAVVRHVKVYLIKYRIADLCYPLQVNGADVVPPGREEDGGDC